MAALPTNPRPWRKLGINLGLVNFEVGIAPLVPESESRGHYFCPQHKTRLVQQYVCAKGKGHVVEEKASGYDVGDGVVIFTDADKEALKVEADKTISLKGFTKIEDIDPIYFEKTYNIWPTDQHHAKAFDAFAHALRKTKKAAVGTCCITKQTRLVILRWSNRTESIVAHVCAFDQNVRWPDAKKVAEGFSARPKPQKEVLAMAEEMISQLEINFVSEVEQLHDEFAARLDEAIAVKAKGGVIPVKEPQRKLEEVPDLLAALKASAKMLDKKPKSKASV